jgi:mannose-6-phosphate isomerase-like protein (cupin superfamily)
MRQKRRVFANEDERKEARKATIRRHYLKKKASDPEYTKKNAEKVKLSYRRHKDKKIAAKYGVTPSDIQEIMQKQGYCCAVCGHPLIETFEQFNNKPHIDHDHRTGKVRGALCYRCNMLLGYAKDNSCILKAASAYLEKHGTSNIRKGFAGLKEGKVWGETFTMLQTPLISMHRLVIKANSHCSMHLHNTKVNSFIVLSGTLFVEVEKKGYPLTDVSTLREGDIISVHPGEYHRFRTGDEPVEALEFYYPEPVSEDILRKDVGGTA